MSGEESTSLSTSGYALHMKIVPTLTPLDTGNHHWIQWARAIYEHVILYTFFFGNSAFLISSVLPEAKFLNCNPVDHENEELAEPMAPTMPILKDFIRRVRLPSIAAVTAPVVVPTAGDADVGVAAGAHDTADATIIPPAIAHGTATTTAAAGVTAAPVPGVLSRGARATSTDTIVYYSSEEDARDAYEVAKGHFDTVLVTKYRSACATHEKAKSESKKQDKNLYNLIMLYVTRPSVNRWRTDYGAQYAAAGQSGFALMKIILVSHRPPEILMQRVCISMWAQVRAMKQNNLQVETHNGRMRIAFQDLLDLDDTVSDRLSLEVYMTSLQPQLVAKINSLIETSAAPTNAEAAMELAKKAELQLLSRFSGYTKVTPAAARAYVATDDVRQQHARRPPTPSGRGQAQPRSSSGRGFIPTPRSSADRGARGGGRGDTRRGARHGDDRGGARGGDNSRYQQDAYDSRRHCSHCWTTKGRVCAHSLEQCRSRLGSGPQEQAYSAVTELCYNTGVIRVDLADPTVVPPNLQPAEGPEAVPSSSTLPHLPAQGCDRSLGFSEHIVVCSDISASDSDDDVASNRDSVFKSESDAAIDARMHADATTRIAEVSARESDFQARLKLHDGSSSIFSVKSVVTGERPLYLVQDSDGNSTDDIDNSVQDMLSSAEIRGNNYLRNLASTGSPISLGYQIDGYTMKVHPQLNKRELKYYVAAYLDAQECLQHYTSLCYHACASVFKRRVLEISFFISHYFHTEELQLQARAALPHALYSRHDTDDLSHVIRGNLRRLQTRLKSTSLSTDERQVAAQDSVSWELFKTAVDTLDIAFYSRLNRVPNPLHIARSPRILPVYVAPSSAPSLPVTTLTATPSAEKRRAKPARSARSSAPRYIPPHLSVPVSQDYTELREYGLDADCGRRLAHTLHPQFDGHQPAVYPPNDYRYVYNVSAHPCDYISQQPYTCIDPPAWYAPQQFSVDQDYYSACYPARSYMPTHSCNPFQQVSSVACSYPIAYSSSDSQMEHHTVLSLAPPDVSEPSTTVPIDYTVMSPTPPDVSEPNTTVPINPILFSLAPPDVPELSTILQLDSSLVYATPPDVSGDSFKDSTSVLQRKVRRSKKKTFKQQSTASNKEPRIHASVHAARGVESSPSAIIASSSKSIFSSVGTSNSSTSLNVSRPSVDLPVSTQPMPSVASNTLDVTPSPSSSIQSDSAELCFSFSTANHSIHNVNLLSPSKPVVSENHFDVIMDSGATVSLCNRPELLHDIRPIRRVRIAGVGSQELSADHEGQFGPFGPALLVPEVSRNILSQGVVSQFHPVFFHSRPPSDDASDSENYYRVKLSKRTTIVFSFTTERLYSLTCHVSLLSYMTHTPDHLRRVQHARHHSAFSLSAGNDVSVATAVVLHLCGLSMHDLDTNDNPTGRPPIYLPSAPEWTDCTSIVMEYKLELDNNTAQQSHTSQFLTTYIKEIATPSVSFVEIFVRQSQIIQTNLIAILYFLNVFTIALDIDPIPTHTSTQKSSTDGTLRYNVDQFLQTLYKQVCRNLSPMYPYTTVYCSNAAAVLDYRNDPDFPSPTCANVITVESINVVFPVTRWLHEVSLLSPDAFPSRKIFLDYDEVMNSRSSSRSVLLVAFSAQNVYMHFFYSISHLSDRDSTDTYHRSVAQIDGECHKCYDFLRQASHYPPAQWFTIYGIWRIASVDHPLLIPPIPRKRKHEEISVPSVEVASTSNLPSNTSV